ncbi:MAG: hypothetical protein JSS81_09235 [Acidobacteria bacterium]|nr:hypothetical protein [Acidobacteriota bacterium]
MKKSLYLLLITIFLQTLAAGTQLHAQERRPNEPAGRPSARLEVELITESDNPVLKKGRPFPLVVRVTNTSGEKIELSEPPYLWIARVGIKKGAVSSLNNVFTAQLKDNRQTKKSVLEKGESIEFRTDLGETELRNVLNCPCRTINIFDALKKGKYNINARVVTVAADPAKSQSDVFESNTITISFGLDENLCPPGIPSTGLRP